MPLGLGKIILFAPTLAAVKHVFQLPRNYPNAVILQLTSEPGAPIPHLPSDQWTTIGYGVADGLRPGPDGGIVGEPGGEHNTANWGPYHPFKRMGAFGQCDGPRVVIEPGGYYEIDKPRTSEPLGIEAIGFSSTEETGQ